MAYFRTDPSYRLRLLKVAAAACVIGLHLAVVAAIVASPAQPAQPEFGSPVQVSIVDLLSEADAANDGAQAIDSVSPQAEPAPEPEPRDRKSTRLNSSHYC